MAELLIEIFTEELPALPLLRNVETMQKSWNNILSTNHLASSFDFFYTPRRLVFIHNDFSLKQDDREIQSYGPPLSIAYNADKSPTKAMQSFLQKNNISANEVRTTLKDNKEVLFYQKIQEGKLAQEILPQMVYEWLTSLNFGKSMRWGNYKEGFIRPIRNICILLDYKLIECDLYGLSSSNIIKAHRQAKTSQATITNTESYLQFLKNHGVILSQVERRQLILESIAKLEKQHAIKVEMDNELLDEIIAITEYPSVLLGRFDERFLKIPQEMIITSMKENQRYFAVYKNERLYNGFIVVSNAFGGDFDLIVRGNEKVLKARLQDAEFFYENDLKAKMNFGNLHNIGFLEGAGNLSDKIQRELEVAQNLIAMLNTMQESISSKELDSITQALKFAKCDLLSQSVNEFPELQGIMGSDFAKHINFDENICLAIKEQYLPHGLDSNLPSQKVSAIVNIAIKLDTLFTLFNLNKIPTGSKDPFALRRQASAILKICHVFGFDMTLDSLCALSKEKYCNITLSSLKAFIQERIYGIFSEINPSIIRCVLMREFGIAESFDKIIALHSYLSSVDIKSVISTFKRVANILETDETHCSNINETLFEESEKELYKSLQDYTQQKQVTQFYKISSQDRITALSSLITKTYTQAMQHYATHYLTQMQLLFTLKTKLDKVFDSVLINAEDRRLKTNRIALITLVFNEFLEFGDMREISL